MTKDRPKNERARQAPDHQKQIKRTLEGEAREQLRRLDNWIIREAIRQGVWEE